MTDRIGRLFPFLRRAYMRALRWCGGVCTRLLEIALDLFSRFFLAGLIPKGGRRRREKEEMKGK